MTSATLDNIRLRLNPTPLIVDPLRTWQINRHTFLSQSDF